MRIAADHAEQGNPLLHALGAALEALGAAVVVTAGGDNLVRRTGDKRVFEVPPGAGPHRGPSCAEIRVEGLANLLHEAGHVVLRGCLDDDHGIDYGAIPFDLRTAPGRAVLFEELACCVLSCSYLAGPDATRDAQPDAEPDGWFLEQVEIQPVFYGMEDDVPGFWHVVADAYAAHRDEADAIIDAAFDRVESLLRWSGAPATLACVPVRLELADMLDRRAASVA
jgi:hypothetical protein